MADDQGSKDVQITVQPSERALALDAAAAANANQLAAMKREIQQLEEQVLKGGSQPQVTVLCFDLSRVPFSTQLLVAGTMICYLSFGVLQEDLIKNDLQNELAWFLTLAQFAFYFLFALIQVCCFKRGSVHFEWKNGQHALKLAMYAKNELRRNSARYVHDKMTFELGGCFLNFLLLVATMGLSNLSVVYLNYPTQVIFKSAKPVPTLLFGVLYHAKRYSPSDYIAVALMLLGMAAFCLTDAAHYDFFSAYGVALVVAAILADATSGAVQERVQAQYKAPQDEVVLYTHLTGMVYLILICLFGRELGEGVSSMMTRPKVLAKIIGFSMTGYVGASFLKALRTGGGALMALLATTTRKCGTLALSTALFPKPFGPNYIVGAATFFLGTLLHSPAIKVRLRVWFGASSWAGKLLQAEPKRRRAVRLFK